MFFYIESYHLLDYYYVSNIAFTIRFIWCPYCSYLINIGSSNADIMFLSFSKKNVKNNVK
jgi:hypothetical protein